MIGARAGRSPAVAASARVSAAAHVLGDVRIGEGCVIDAGAVVTSSGPPVDVGDGAVIMAGAVVRSVGGAHRPPFPVAIGRDSMIGPAAVLAGCEIGEAVYVATQVMVFQGARVGDGTRLGAGSIVHTGAVLPARSRVGMRQYAVAAEDGGAVLVTGDLALAREHLARAGFFDRVFEMGDEDVVELHRRTVRVLRDEAADWEDAAP